MTTLFLGHAVAVLLTFQLLGMGSSFLLPCRHCQHVHYAPTFQASTPMPMNGEPLPPWTTRCNLNVPSCDDDKKTSSDLTSAILKISFVGTRFSGWTATNSGDWTQHSLHIKNQTDGSHVQSPLGRGNNTTALPRRPFVRPVDKEIQHCLAKLYGNVNPQRIVVEGCSRTDRGVHAQGMIAQVYCLKENVTDSTRGGNISYPPSSIPGKRLPHPLSSTDDSYFAPLPMKSNLSSIAYCLNRQLPSAVQVIGIAPTPQTQWTQHRLDNLSSQSPPPPRLPFHPSLSAHSKTYKYNLSVGAFHDPTLRHFTWYVGHSLDILKMQQACDVLVGEHDFLAFQASGSTSHKGGQNRHQQLFNNQESLSLSSTSSKCTHLRNTVCHLTNVSILPMTPPTTVYFPGVVPPLQHYQVVIQGNRFLYKMIRFLVGALVAVSKETLNVSDIQRALQIGHWKKPDGSRKEFECAPPHGLSLAHVDYHENATTPIDWVDDSY